MTLDLMAGVLLIDEERIHFILGRDEHCGELHIVVRTLIEDTGDVPLQN